MKMNRNISILLACLASAWMFGSRVTAGTLVGSRVAAPGSINLTEDGTLDWAHWGLSTSTDFDQKSGGTNQIGNYTEISLDGSFVAQFGNAAAGFSWTDGTPTESANNSTTGVYIPGLDNGFQFTVAADTTPKFLKVYSGCWNAQSRFEASLSDGSAVAYADDSLDDYGSGSVTAHTIKFAANSAGQTLTIKITSIALHGGGNSTLLGATLGTPPPGPTAMGVSTQVHGSASVFNGREASFSFETTNNAIPVVTASYQWYKNGQIATNVTGNSFTFLATPSDNGAQVYCVSTLPEVFNGNHLPPLISATGTVTVLTGVTYTNGLKVEVFSGATRQEVEAGNVAPATAISLASSFETPFNVGILNFTRRVSGYFIPPASGDYVFFISSDDDGDLFLSTDSNPAHKRLIAQENNWSNSRQWVSSGGNSTISQKRSDQWSPDQGANVPYGVGIPLTAGQSYYIEGLEHQGVGGDNFAVTYKLIAEADPLDGDAPLLQATNHNIAVMTSPTTNLVWVTQPTSETNFIGRTITLSSSATSDSEFKVLYQWYRNNNAVAGATAASFSFPAVVEDNNTQWYAAASTAEGGLTTNSVVATLTIKTAAFPQGLITFEDQDPAGLDTTGAMAPNPYTDLQGLPSGVIANLVNFNSWNADPQHTPGGLWLVYGEPDGFAPGDCLLTFNIPVEVPSLWVTTGPYGTLGSSLKAYLNGIEQFAYTNTSFATITECTNGAGVLIDKIAFSNYGGSEMDDIMIVKPTTLLTFSDQIGNDVPANPNPYTGAKGLWPGVTATFDQFNNWNGSTDHTPDTSDNFLLYGANYEAGGVASITFNTLVEVPSLWVNYQGDGSLGAASLAGYSNGVAQFTQPVTASVWTEVTAGAGKPIDSLRFTNYGDSWIDDVTVNAVSNPKILPASARLNLVKGTSGTLTLSWTGQGRLEESASLTEGWETSVNQTNPHAVTVGTGNKFYRIVYP
jgi:hypothetical protein